jgi:hypothetical protein
MDQMIARPFRLSFRWPAWLAVALAIAGGWALNAQMVPDAPIEHFRLPMFGDNGYKSWELRGLRGHYLSEESALVEGLDLVVYSGDAALTEENRICSPRARIQLKEARASGESSLFVTGPGYDIQGRNWTWDGIERKIIVRQSVRVSFAGSLDILE